MNNKRYIEEFFPIAEVSKESARDKYLRHGHISTLHVWWASRPLAISRASNYAALIDSPKDKNFQNEADFISKLSKFETTDNGNIINRARRQIIKNFQGKKPKILDPFGGRGSIPLEALRLGCDTYSMDYNPVAVLIQKCILEYPQKFGLELLEEVNKYSNKLINNLRKDLSLIYPSRFSKQPGIDGERIIENIPISYFWCRTIPCTNIDCNSEIPLFRQYWLVKKKNKKITLFPQIHDGSIKFKIIRDPKEIPKDFDPKKGSVYRGIVECLVCGTVIKGKNVKKQFNRGLSSHKLIAIAERIEGETGKNYRIVDEDKEKENYELAKELIEKYSNKLKEYNVMNPIPDEIIYTPNNEEYKSGNLLYNFTPVLLYGLTTWNDLFNKRQLASLLSIVYYVNKFYYEMVEEGFDHEFSKAIVTYLSLVLDMMAAFSNNLARWENTSEAVKQIFSRQAIQMMWDWVEVNPLGGASGSIETGIEYYLKVLDHLVKSQNYPATVEKGSATNLPFKDNYFDGVFTDPPYYDNVPYASLSDFFYVWLKRALGNFYPELFSSPLTPKSNEIIAELPLIRGMRKSKAIEEYPSIKDGDTYERLLSKSFSEIYRVLKPKGIGIIVYAHKTTEGWEKVINALLDSKLVITATWPISTEMRSRLRGQKSAALASSIYLIVRKQKREQTGIYPDVKEKLFNYLDEQLDVLWKSKIHGSELFISAIGVGIEVFGQYDNIINYDGDKINTEKLLDDIRNHTTNFAIKRILENGFSMNLSPLSKLYLIWRWNFGSAKLEFDEANKIAQSIGVNLDQKWNRSVIQKKGKYITLLGPKDREIETLKDSKELVDILHLILLQWEKGKFSENKRLIRKSKNQETIYKYAQAISETLDIKDKEKKLLDGFLSGRDKMADDILAQDSDLEDYF